MSEKPSQSIRKASQIVKILCGLTKLVLRNDFPEIKNRINNRV
jgi:hypothetical protein